MGRGARTVKNNQTLSELKNSKQFKVAMGKAWLDANNHTYWQRTLGLEEVEKYFVPWIIQAINKNRNSGAKFIRSKDFKQKLTEEWWNYSRQINLSNAAPWDGVSIQMRGAAYIRIAKMTEGTLKYIFSIPSLDNKNEVVDLSTHLFGTRKRYDTNINHFRK
jgi:hypothetical protein